jgi:Raf kinase inhibitor-like YbhB/YbcL family protein
MTKFHLRILIFPLILFTAGCGNSPKTAPVFTIKPAPTPAPGTPLPVSFSLSSPAFADGEELADLYTYKLGRQCNGKNLSPALIWSNAPAGTQSFALTMLDPDGGNWLHWLLFNIPADTTGLPEAPDGPEIGVRGKNDFGSLGYGGPCPPSGTHHYIFTLYALDTLLKIPEGARLGDFEQATQGHILAQAQLTGLQTR